MTALLAFAPMGLDPAMTMAGVSPLQPPFSGSKLA
jgi:hypothetical protein